MYKLGFVGWRGMVGSVLLERMQQQQDFAKLAVTFFSSSAAGMNAPVVANGNPSVVESSDLEQLAAQDCIVTTQGSDYTLAILPQLRKLGWQGYWLDASSALRMEDNSIIVLDPVNRTQIDQGLASGIKNFVGGNCTVSLMLLAIDGLLKADVVEWVSAMTYQAASGAGANHIRELIAQQGFIYESVNDLLQQPNLSVLELERKVTAALNSAEFPQHHFTAALAGNVLPWIDVAVSNGQTKEEWKGGVEANKILGYAPDTLKVDGICVRVGALRSHSQALTIKLKRKDLSIEQLRDMLATANPWVKLVDNTKQASLNQLTPVKISGSLEIAVGRLKKMKLGEDYISLFTVGDQLLWGAAEPLRRMLNILVEWHA